MDVPVIIAALTFGGVIGGGVFAWGRLREQVVMEEECATYRSACQGQVCKKVEEIKDLVNTLHDKDTERIKYLASNLTVKIETMDQKREGAKDSLYTELKKLSETVARIEGRMSL